MISPRSWPAALARRTQHRLLPWWHITRLGSLVLVLALSPSSYLRTQRPVLARHLVAAAMPVLGWFTLLSALASLVITRIVLVTALSYGLSQYALETVVRVLVLELIPLTAALFVALRWSIPAAATLAAMRRSGELGALRRAGIDALRNEVLPRALAGMFTVLLLAAVSSLVALVLAYVLAHGLSPWGLEGYTRLVGHVFSPAVSLVFGLKTLALAGAVALIPIGSALHNPQAGRGPIGREPVAADSADPGHGPGSQGAPASASADLQGLVRMALAILLIEMVSLMGNYS